MERTTKSNLNNLITLTRFLKYLGLSPCYDGNDKIYTKSKLQAFCGAMYILIILTIFLAFVNFYLMYYVIVVKSSITVCVLDNMCSLLLTMVTFTTIFNTNYFNNAKYLEILNDVLQIEDSLTKFEIDNISDSWYFYVEIIFIHTISCFNYVFGIYLTVAHYFPAIQIFLHSYIQWHYAATTISLMRNIITTLKCQFETVNHILLQTTVGIRKLNCMEINTLQTTYMLIVKQIQHFTATFGSVIFILITCITVNYISRLNVSLDERSFIKQNIILSYCVFWSLATLVSIIY